MGKTIPRFALLLGAVAISLAACGTAASSSTTSSSAQSASSAASIASPPPAPIPITLAEGANPLTGLAEGATQGAKPLAIMIDNVKTALPQRGLAAADIIFEAVTESGITRLLAFYSDYTTIPEIGPVRSARDQHVQIMMPLNALYVHVGGSTYANAMLAQYNWAGKSLDGLNTSGVLELDADRNASIGITHCWFTNSTLLSEAIKSYELDTAQASPIPAFQFVPYNEDKRLLSEGDALGFSVRFSSYTTANFAFDSASGKYQKGQFGQPQIDENTGETIGFDNVLILFTEVTKYPDGILAHVNYAFGGVGVYFNGGRYERVRWMKGNADSPLRIVDLGGHEKDVALNPGTTYVAMADINNYPFFNISATGPLPARTAESHDPSDVIESPDVSASSHSSSKSVEN